MASEPYGEATISHKSLKQLAHRKTARHKFQHLRKLFYESGLEKTLAEILHTLRTSIWKRDVVQISGRIVKDHLLRFSAMEFPPGIECKVAESVDALENFRNEIPPSFRDSFHRLRERLAEGCVVFFATRQGETGPGNELLGYSLAQKGVFSALGRKGKLSPDTLFIHYIEVVPAHRGRSVAKLLIKARLQYCEKKGLKRTVTVGSPLNELSGQAFRQSKHEQRILGKVERVSILRGLLVWQTPWKKIEKALSHL